MRRIHLLAFLAFTLACGGAGDGPGPGSEPPPGAVAAFDGGWLSFEEVEERLPAALSPACRASRRAAGGGSLEELLPCYREVAEELALERLVLADMPPAELEPEALGERFPELRQRAFVGLYYQRLNEEIEISDEEIERHFEAHRERFRRPRQLTLWNIFRRHDGADPRETHAFLRQLKERFLAGETFAALAREHSQSETRLRDGLVGTIHEGRLPERLVRIAFALEEGGVSDPVPVQGGAVLLQVRHLVPGGEPELESVRRQVRRELGREKLEAAVTERLAGLRPPPGARLLDSEELLAALDGDDDAVVLDLGVPLTVADLRGMAGLPSSVRGKDLSEEAHGRLEAVYGAQSERQLLLLDLLETADLELRAEAEELLVESAVSRLVDEILAETIGRKVDADPGALRQYYDDNPAHYQSPLRFRLWIWDVPFGADPPAQLEALEKAQDSLEAGELDLDAAAASFGGEIRDLGWRELDELVDVIPDKGRVYLAQVEAGGYSVPYQQDDALHLLAVEERSEPGPLSYEQAAEQVRRDYLERFRQRLSREVLGERLAAAGFLFDEEAVRGRLDAPFASPAGE